MVKGILGPKGFTLVEVMLTAAIITLLAAIAIPNLLRARMTANDAAAQATLKTFANAIETYAAANSGVYPTNITDLVGVSPPYLSEDYTAAPRQGFSFACGTLDVGSYSCTATPTSCNHTGSKVFTVTTGAILSAANCS